jgi:DNA repair protein RadC
MNIKYLPLKERPLHRVTEAATACTLVELLAALVGGQQQIEIAEGLLQRFGSLRALRMAPASEIATISGIGQQTAARLVSALELGKRLVSETEEEKPVISSPTDAANLVRYEMSTLEQEELWVILLNTRNRVIEIEKLYRGSLNSSQVRVGEIFKAAIRRNAATVIVAHSHPSGDPTPSPDDVAITRAIAEAGQLVDTQLLDHLVIGHNRWVSLKERGLGGL